MDVPAPGYTIPDSEVVAVLSLRVHPDDVKAIHAVAGVICGLRQHNLTGVHNAAEALLGLGLVLGSVEVNT
jgi:hypothetical protein